MTDPKTALQKLSARGITTLEQFAESKAHMRKPRRIDSEKAFEEISARSAAPSDSSVKSKIGAPSSSVPIVLDGKRVEYNEIARFNQPLDYVATTLKGGEPALVVFSDRSIIKNHRLRQFKGSLQAINKEVENALMAGGLHPSPTLVPRIDLGLRMFEDINYGGGSWTLAPEEYVDDLTQFDEGLGWFGGDWNDKISSVQMGRCYCYAWEHTHEGGASLTLYEDTPNLHILGWGDVISSIWAAFNGAG